MYIVLLFAAEIVLAVCSFFFNARGRAFCLFGSVLCCLFSLLAPKYEILNYVTFFNINATIPGLVVPWIMPPAVSLVNFVAKAAEEAKPKDDGNQPEEKNV